MTNTETHADPIGRTPEDAERPDTSSERADYGGMGAKLDQVDLAHANDVGADPPGGLGTDIAGGNRELGQDTETPEDSVSSGA